MKNAINWFEIPSTRINQAQAFYEAVLDCKLHREPMGPSEGAVFPYEGEGVGGALPGVAGVAVYRGPGDMTQRVANDSGVDHGECAFDSDHAVIGVREGK